MTTFIRNADDIFEMFLCQAVIDFTYWEADQVPPKEEIDIIYAMSESHAKRMKDLCSKVNRKEWLTRKAIPGIKRIAAAILIIFAILSGTMMAYPEVRAVVADVFVEWFNQFTQFSGTGTIITEQKWELSYIPDGYVEIGRSESAMLSAIRYENSDGIFLDFIYQPDIGTIGIDNEDMVYSEAGSGGVLYRIFESIDGQEANIIFWVDNNFLFEISGYLPTEFLIEMAASVKKN